VYVYVYVYIDNKLINNKKTDQLDRLLFF